MNTGEFVDVFKSAARSEDLLFFRSALYSVKKRLEKDYTEDCWEDDEFCQAYLTVHKYYLRVCSTCTI